MTNKTLSRVMRKSTFCIGETKAQIRFAVTDQCLLFRYMDSTIPLSKTNFQASSYIMCLYSSVCVGPVRKPLCWF